MQEQHSFGYWLRLKRKAHLTREALADRVGCSVSTIRKLEDEERRPSAQIAELLAEIFQIPTLKEPPFYGLRTATGDLLPAWGTKKPPGAFQHRYYPNNPIRIYRGPSLP
jgi:transcriptional regulator with XRE-family HTH domain